MTKLDELLSVITQKHVYIQTHNFPDTDAIASAYGMKVLLESRGITSTICHKGRLDRYSTSKLVELLDVEMSEMESLEKEGNLACENEIILVDSQKGNSNIVDMEGEEIICIDHHPVFDQSSMSYKFSDIRPQYGACASIIAEYFVENGIPFDRKTATLLTYGIRMDTAGLSRGVCKADIEMLARLFDTADYELIYRLENSTLYREDLRAYAKAIKNIEIYDNISFADTGKNCPETLIACICDFMLALVEVELSIVYSVKKAGIKLSVRSEGRNLDAGRITREALRGIGDGGGHAAMAGGFVPFTGSAEDGRTLIQDIKERYLAVVHRSGTMYRHKTAAK